MAFINKTWKALKPVLLNKYLVVLLAFAVFIIFFDDHNLIQRWETHRKINQMEKEYKYYLDETYKSILQHFGSQLLRRSDRQDRGLRSKSQFR